MSSRSTLWLAVIVVVAVFASLTGSSPSPPRFGPQPSESESGWIVGLVVLGVVGLVVWLAFGSRGEGGFRARVRSGGPAGLRCEIVGLSEGSADELRALVLRLDLPPGAEFWGQRGPDGWELRFNFRVPAHHQQRLRNFMALHR